MVDASTSPRPVGTWQMAPATPTAHAGRTVELSDIRADLFDVRLDGVVCGVIKRNIKRLHGVIKHAHVLPQAAVDT